MLAVYKQNVLAAGGGELIGGKPATDFNEPLGKLIAKPSDQQTTCIRPASSKEVAKLDSVHFLQALAHRSELKLNLVNLPYLFFWKLKNY